MSIPKNPKLRRLWFKRQRESHIGQIPWQVKKLGRKLTREEILEKKRARALVYRKRYRKILRKRNKKWYNKNRQRALFFMKRWRDRIKLEVFSYYSKGKNECECCKEKHMEFLAIDHVNGQDYSIRAKKKGIKGGTRFYKWLKDNQFPKGFRVLCFNCNHSFGSFKYCPHKKQNV